MASWALVTTVKAPKDELLAFVAHHLSLGASHLYIYFDDPADPAVEAVAGHPRITAIRCTDWYWLLRGGRYHKLQKRQVRNARHAQARCRCDWLGHVDVDEFLHAPRPVSELLAEVPPDVPDVVMEPFEAMHDPDLPDDIFTARHFRGVLNGRHAALQPAVFGPAAVALRKGGLGHVVGKSFCRPRARGIAIGLHLVKRNGVNLWTPFHPELRLLHFHAQDPVAWRRALPFRLSHGAYYHSTEQALRSYLEGASDARVREFYTAAMTLTPETAQLLQQHDRLVTADLGLRAKVAASQGGDPG